MKELQLTNGGVTLVDDDIYEQIKIYNWRRDKLANHVVRTTGPKQHRKIMRLHRFVMNAQKGQIVDHINGNVLDNRKENLRFASKSTNGMNRLKQANNKSGYKGVCYHKSAKKWVAQLTVSGKRVINSFHETAEEAAEAYKNAALLHHKQFAKF